MNNIIKALMLFSLLVSVSACSGMRRSGDQFTLHAESLNLLGLRIPGDDHERAMQAVPSGAQIETVLSSPSDWTSTIGVINRIVGISVTEVSGEIKG